MQFSASPFSVDAFDRARHDHELVADGFTHVHLDAVHMGVGGDDSWSPTVHEEYLVAPGEYTLALVLSGTRDGESAQRAAAELWQSLEV
jgi:beta-galactosidase